MSVIFCFFPVILMSSTYTDKRRPYLWWTNMHSQFGTFSNPSSNKASSNSLHSNPMGSCQCSPKISAILWRGKRTHTSGHSDFWMFSNLGASSNFACVSKYCISCLSVTIWKSCNNIHDFCDSHLWRRRTLLCENGVSSWIIFYNVPRSTTLPFVFPQLGFQLRILEVTYVHLCTKVNFLDVSLCFQENIFLHLGFVRIPCWDCLETICEHTFDSSPTDSSSSSLKWWSSKHGVATLKSWSVLFVCQFTISFNAFFRVAFHVAGARDSFCARFVPSW